MKKYQEKTQLGFISRNLTNIRTPTSKFLLPVTGKQTDGPTDIAITVAYERLPTGITSTVR